jgi:predicted nucleic acid-binding protein
MRKCYIDSNVLIYFKDEAAPQYTQAKENLANLLNKDCQLFISPLVLDEFLHGAVRTFLRGKRDVYTPLAVALKSILEIPSLTVINPPTDISAQKHVVSFMKKYALRPRDAYHLLIMQTNRIEGFATFDSDFHRVFSAKVLNKA